MWWHRPGADRTSNGPANEILVRLRATKYQRAYENACAMRERERERERERQRERDRERVVHVCLKVHDTLIILSQCMRFLTM